jgi:hypothetical protein
MGGVDSFDQKASYYTYPHKFQKWYQAVYQFAKDAALVNAYILYQADNPNSNLTSAGLRKAVAEKLCEAIPRNVNANKGRHSLDNSESTEARLKERHFPYDVS